MWTRKNDDDATMAELATDPLALRVFARTQPELRRDERREAWFRGATSGGGASGNALAGMAIAFVLATLWAILSSIPEQIAYEWNRAKAARRTRRTKPDGRGIRVHFPEA